MYNFKKTSKSTSSKAMVSTSVWYENKMLTPVARLAYQYMLTCPQRNSLGCFELPLALIEAHIGSPNNKPQAEKAISELTAAELVYYDYRVEMVAIPDWFKHNRAANVHTGYDERLALRIYTKIPTDSKILEIFIDLIKKTPLQNKMPSGFGRPM